jgi:hypothetical protein
VIEQLVVRCTGTSFSASLDGNLMSPAIPVGGAISVRSTRRWSEGTGAVGLSHSLDVLLPNGSYSAAAQRRPESLSPIQRRVRAQSSRAASVPPLGLDSTLDSIDEKRSALGAAPNKTTHSVFHHPCVHKSGFCRAGELDQKERAAAAQLAKRQHLQAQLAHRSKMHEEHQAMVAQERALRSEQNAEVSARSSLSTDQFEFCDISERRPMRVCRLQILGEQRSMTLNRRPVRKGLSAEQRITQNNRSE